LERFILEDLVDSLSQLVCVSRENLKRGILDLPLELGLASPAHHIERGERECYAAALPHIAHAVGPAACVVDCGFFAGHNLSALLSALERPKAGVVLSHAHDPRQQTRLLEADTTAEITFISHDARTPMWPLETMGAGRTLTVLSGGSYGLYSHAQAFEVLENASRAASSGDFVLITLEPQRDAAVIEALYLDYGSQIVTHALAYIGRAEGLTPRVFYDGKINSVRLGAIASTGAAIGWNGTRCAIEPGDWLDLGGITLLGGTQALDLHPDFEIEDQWSSQDQAVSLLLLRKT
jgi:hypothetical protein